jgi:O-antigen/teichoic acid export membrane protein
MSLFLVGANNIDAVILSKLTTMEVVGLYGAASKLVQAFILFRPAIMHSLFPTLSYLAKEAPERFKTVSQQALKFAVVALSPLALLISVMASEIILFLYREQFAAPDGAAVAALQVLIWVVVPSFVYAILTRALIAAGHEKPTIAVAALSLFTNIGLDLLLIPAWGAAGAAWATLMATGLAVVTSYVLVQRRLFSVDFGPVIARPGLAILCLSIIALALRELPGLLLVPLLLALYLLLLFLLQVTRLEEWLVLWQAVRNRMHRREVRV